MAFCLQPSCCILTFYLLLIHTYISSSLILGDVRPYLGQEQEISYLKSHLVLLCILYLLACVCLRPGEAAWNVETILSFLVLYFVCLLGACDQWAWVGLGGLEGDLGTRVWSQGLDHAPKPLVARDNAMKTP